MSSSLGRTVRALGAVGAALLVAASTVRPATAEDIDSLRAHAQSVADRVSSLERDLEALNGRKSRLDREIDDASRSIGLLELTITEAERAYETALDDYVAAAVEIYKAGPTANLDLLLSARTVSELLTLAEASSTSTDAATDSIAELARERAAADAAQARIDEHKQDLLAAQAGLDEVAGEISSTLADRRAVLTELNKEIADLEEKARAAAAAAAQPSSTLLKLLSPSGPAAGIPDGFAGTGVTFEGIASWYGPGFEGNPTANGDIFDPDLFTAASKELPLGSWLYVEHEGRDVVVLVNDRGPYVDGRILDLSHAAAQAIGITGLGWIKAEILLKL